MTGEVGKFLQPYRYCNSYRTFLQNISLLIHSTGISETCRRLTESERHSCTEHYGKMPLVETVPVLHLVSRIPGRRIVGQQPTQAVHAHTPLSPSSITWYRCKSHEGNSRLWKEQVWSTVHKMLGISQLP